MNFSQTLKRKSHCAASHISPLRPFLWTLHPRPDCTPSLPRCSLGSSLSPSRSTRSRALLWPCPPGRCPLLPPPPAVPLRSECLPHCLPSARALLSGLWALWMLLPGQRAPLPPLWAPVLPPDTYILQSSKLFLLPQVTFSLAQTAPAPPLCSEPGSTGPSTPFSAFLTSPALPDSWFPITLSPSWPSFPSQARFLLHQQMTTAAYFIFKSDIK